MAGHIEHHTTRPDTRSYALVVCVALLLGATPAIGFDTEAVVIVVIDGPRLTETFEEPGTPHVLRMATDLLPQGTHLPNFHNSGSTYTLRGFGSIASGTWQHIPNDGTEQVTKPTLFEYYRAHTGAPPTDTWLVSGKEKMDSIAYSSHPLYGKRFGAMTDNVERTDAPTMDAFKSVLATYHPTLSVLGLTDVDIFGHAGDWPGYLAAIGAADSLVVDLWNWLQADPTYAGTTTMIVTSDHGRHDDAHGGFAHHGDACAGCVRIPFFALGPDFFAGQVSKTLRRQTDVCRTVGTLLDFPAPEAEGFVLGELFVESTAVVDLGAGSVTGTPLALRARPNPFNPSVAITLILEESGFVALDLHDASGRRVASLWNGVRTRGLLSTSWNGRLGDGRSAPSGIYFLRARTPSASRTLRIDLVR